MSAPEAVRGMAPTKLSQRDVLFTVLRVRGPGLLEVAHVDASANPVAVRRAPNLNEWRRLLCQLTRIGIPPGSLPYGEGKLDLLDWQATGRFAVFILGSILCSLPKTPK